MGWEKDEAACSVTFFCDGQNCERSRTYNEPLPNHISVFAGCWQRAEADGWRSFKQVGRNWRYFCKGCADAAEQEHHDYNAAEHERERVKERNARYFGE